MDWLWLWLGLLPWCVAWSVLGVDFCALLWGVCSELVLFGCFFGGLFVCGCVVGWCVVGCGFFFLVCVVVLVFGGWGFGCLGVLFGGVFWGVWGWDDVQLGCCFVWVLVVGWLVGTLPLMLAFVGDWWFLCFISYVFVLILLVCFFYILFLFLLWCCVCLLISFFILILFFLIVYWSWWFFLVVWLVRTLFSECFWFCVCFVIRFIVLCWRWYYVENHLVMFWGVWFIWLLFCEWSHFCFSCSGLCFGICLYRFNLVVFGLFASGGWVISASIFKFILWWSSVVSFVLYYGDIDSACFEGFFCLFLSFSVVN